MRELIDSLIKQGETALTNVTNQVLTNEYLVQMIERVMDTRDIIDRKVQALLHSMNLATRQDLGELVKRIDQLERKLDRFMQPRSPKAAPAERATCPVCGRSFVKKTYNQKYCSIDCRKGVA
jgi:polyhydroxyalkanoate synthesis regulator phasin